MSDANNYQAAALAALQGGTPAPAESPAAPPAEAPAAPPAETPAAPAPAVDAKLAEAPAETPPPDSIKKSFERLAKQNAELREREAKIKAYEEAVGGFDPRVLSAIAQAAKAGDAAAVLQTLGLRAPEVQPDPGKGDPVVARLQQELLALKTRIETDSYERGRQRMLERVSNVAKVGKFTMASVVDDAPQRALAFIEDFVRKNGAPAPDEVDGIIESALKAVDEDLGSEAKKWEAYLTKVRGSGTSQDNRAPAPPAPAPAQPSRTITNTLQAPAPARPATEPKTPADYRAEALEVLQRAANSR